MLLRTIRAASGGRPSPPNPLSRWREERGSLLFILSCGGRAIVWGDDPARLAIRACLDVLTILPVDAAILEHAFTSGVQDFEDALQLACATRAGLDAIITRDAQGFAGASIPIWTPDELVRQLPPASAP